MILENTGDGSEEVVAGQAEETCVVRPSGAASEEATQLPARIECPVCGTSNPESETYCTDCGFLLSSQPAGPAPGTIEVPRLVTADGSREFLLRPGENTIGRENTDILLAHNTVSRRHARVDVRGDGIFIVDLGSTNGTFVDGRRLSEGETAVLTDGSEIVIGSVSLRCQAVAANGESVPGELDAVASEVLQQHQTETVDGAVPESAAEENPEPPVAVARLVSSDSRLVLEILEGVNTLGRRAAENSIVVDDPYVSGRHADITASGGSISIVDVGSTNGTLVNGVKIEPGVPVEIRLGDEITVGQTVFRLEDA